MKNLPYSPNHTYDDADLFHYRFKNTAYETKMSSAINDSLHEPLIPVNEASNELQDKEEPLVSPHEQQQCNVVTIYVPYMFLASFKRNLSTRS